MCAAYSNADNFLFRDIFLTPSRKSQMRIYVEMGMIRSSQREIISPLVFSGESLEWNRRRFIRKIVSWKGDTSGEFSLGKNFAEEASFLASPCREIVGADRLRGAWKIQEKDSGRKRDRERLAFRWPLNHAVKIYRVYVSYTLTDTVATRSLKKGTNRASDVY